MFSLVMKYIFLKGVGTKPWKHKANRVRFYTFNELWYGTPWYENIMKTYMEDAKTDCEHSQLEYHAPSWMDK